MKFEITNKQLKLLKEWKRSLPKKQAGEFGAIDYGYSYCFTPTGIGEVLIVKRSDGHDINLTDYDEW